MKKFEVIGHAPSLLPDGEWKLVWADEFDGLKLDETKWDYRLHIWGKRFVTWDKEGVYLDGKSNAVFRIFEKNGEICTTQLQTGYNWIDAPHTEEALFGDVDQTEKPGLVWPIGKLKEPKFAHRYGYYECRCKLQNYDGWWSAFWMQSPVIGSSLNPAVSGVETDIMEAFKPKNVAGHAIHYNGYGVDHKSKVAGKGKELSKDEYHTFGLLWEEDGYTFFIDGEQDGEKITEPVSKIAQFILLTTEARGYRSDKHTASEEARKAAAAGDKFIVDYVRVFDKVERCL
jgi:beta-glucanase (GH16 family)